MTGNDCSRVFISPQSFASFGSQICFECYFLLILLGGCFKEVAQEAEPFWMHLGRL